MSFLPGPLFVTIGAFLWALDSLFRSDLVAHFSVLFIVFGSHLICQVVSLPGWWHYSRREGHFKGMDLLSLLVLSFGGSVLAMMLFTYAFATTTNYTIPILIQKLQPLVAIFFARVLLKEKLSPKYCIVGFVAMVGAYLVSFGDWKAITALQKFEIVPVLAAFGASVIWGGCTVAGRFLSRKYSSNYITFSRYNLAFWILLVLVLAKGQGSQFQLLNMDHMLDFIPMALGPGLLALLVYYYGLKSTRASVATLCELAFPLGAIVVNWVFLDSALNFWQIFGSIALIGSVTWLNLEEVKFAKVPW